MILGRSEAVLRFLAHRPGCRSWGISHQGVVPGEAGSGGRDSDWEEQLWSDHARSETTRSPEPGRPGGWRSVASHGLTRIGARLRRGRGQAFPCGNYCWWVEVGDDVD